MATAKKSPKFKIGQQVCFLKDNEVVYHKISCIMNVQGKFFYFYGVLNYGMRLSCNGGLKEEDVFANKLELLENL